MSEVRYDDLVTSAQVAGLFGVTIAAIYQWRREGGLPCVRIPGYRKDTIRFKLKDVMIWAEKNGKKTSDQKADEGQVDVGVGPGDQV